MPSDKFDWSWEEAFQVYGFNGGDNPQHSDSVGEFLVSLGWHYEMASTHHNTYINELIKGDPLEKDRLGFDKDGIWIQFEGHESKEEIRKLLPKDVVAALDKEFPDKPEIRLAMTKEELNFLVMGIDQLPHAFSHPSSYRACEPAIKALRKRLVELEANQIIKLDKEFGNPTKAGMYYRHFEVVIGDDAESKLPNSAMIETILNDSVTGGETTVEVKVTDG
jgi:hypothetical protein